MFGRVFAIALNTYRESVRARVLLGLAGLAFAVAMYSLVVGAFTLKNAPRVVSDLGAASISIFSVIVAIVIGATSLFRELEQKTLFPILARPIRRGEYLLGKYLGTLLTIAVFIMADAGLVLLLVAGLGGRPLSLVLGAGLGGTAVLAVAAWRVPKALTYGPIPWAIAMMLVGLLFSGVAPEERRVVVLASALAGLEVVIVAAFATLFAAFSTPFLSSVFTLGVFIVGRQADSLARLPKKYVGVVIHTGGRWLSKLWPNLQVYVPPRPVLTGQSPDVHLTPYMASATLMAIAWAVGLLALAAFIFKKRDFL